MSHAHVRIDASRDLSLFEAMEAFHHTLSAFANFISVQHRGAYVIIADTAIDESGVQQPCPIFEPFFDEIPVGYAFKNPDESRWSSFKLPTELLEPTAKSALHGLTQAVRFSDFTYMYCRLAIEAVRAHYDPEEQRGVSWPVVEGKGERAMCNALNVKRESLKSFQSKAARTRHGKQLVNGTWEERKRALELSWEIVARHIEYLAKGTNSMWPVI